MSDTSEQEAFLGQMGPEGGQAWEAALGLGLTEDHRKIPECIPPSWEPLHFIISFWKHSVDTGPCHTAARTAVWEAGFSEASAPVCKMESRFPLPCPADRKLGTQSVLSHLLCLSCWQLQPQLQLQATGNATRTPVVKGTV